MESNKLIAEFMGIEEAYNPNGNDWVLKTTNPDTYGDTDILESCKSNELKYHTSWDWLMPVVGKISRDEKFFENEYRENLLDVVPYGRIQDVFEAVVVFIKNLEI